jgi:radical SAM superfamily enzyme YgiQ (UPF0313 family)
MRRGDQVLSGGPAGLTENLDSLPIPDYTEYFEELKECGLENKFSKTVIPYESSRGCWWGEKTMCTFCGVNNGRPNTGQISPKGVGGKSFTRRTDIASRIYMRPTAS